MSAATSTKMQMGRVQKYQLDLKRYYRLPAVQSSLTVVLSLFVVTFFVMFALRPTALTIIKLQKTIEDSEKTLESLTTKVAALQRASAVYEELSPVLPMIEASIPGTGSEYPPLASAIEVVARGSGVAIDSEAIGETLLYSRILSPFKPHKTQAVVPLSFTVRVSGNYVSLATFLKNITQMDRLIKLTTVTFTREGAVRGSAAGTTSLTLSGEAYYLADQTQLQKAVPTEKKGGK